MNVEVKQLKDTQTGEVFVPLTHWDAVANKPEDIAKEATSQEISNKLNDVAQESTSQEILSIWDAVSIDSEEIITDEQIHETVEDIWNITFNS